MAQRSLTVRLSRRALAEVQSILDWTEQRFGDAQRETCAKFIMEAIDALRKTGFDTLGVRARDDITKDLYSVHVARRGRKGRHAIFFRRGDDSSRDLIVLRVLHDSMDLVRHIRNPE